MVTKDDVLAALRKVYSIKAKNNIVDAGFVRDISTEGGSVYVKLHPISTCPFGFAIAVKCEEELKKLEGVKHANVKVVL